MPKANKPLYFPPERERAYERYEKKFGKEFPLYLTYEVFGNDWEKEIKYIDYLIAKGEPARDRPMDKKNAY